jgi:type II secretory pathway pseudopilin PulG
MKKLNNKGQTLIEALVALGVATIVISAIAISVITGMDNANFAKNQNLATQFAQQGMDILRQQSQSDWTSFSAKPLTTYCLNQGNADLSANCSSANINSFFLRKVILSGSNPAGPCTTGEKISVVVSWSDGKCPAANRYCHNVTLDSCAAQINNFVSP